VAPVVPAEKPALAPPPAPQATNAALPAAIEDKPSAASSSGEGIQQKLLEIVSERTGYPVDLIGLDLDLEADLGIDSIKRVEILGSLQQQTSVVGSEDMESLSAQKTLGDVIRYLEARSNGSAKKASRPPLPFIRRIEKLVPGEELLASAVLDLDHDLFLRDHSLGRRLSVSDPSLTGLPVVPLTMGMEILAEAALALSGEATLKVVGLREVRAHRWMMLDRDELPLEIAARRVESPDGLLVQVKIFEGSASKGSPIVEGKVLLRERYPDPPPAAGLVLAGERKSTWAPERLYEEIMFHGPRFQGVRSMERWGRDGATARLKTLPADTLFAGTDSPALALDPVLLDQPGQVVGFWTSEHLERGYVVFPFQLDALDLFRPAGPISHDLECRARIRLIGEEAVDSDLDVVALESGGERILCRFQGWKDLRFDPPRPFLRFLHDPVRETLTESRPEVPGAYRLRVQGFPAGFFVAHGAVWLKALSKLILGRNERRAWDGLSLPPSDRVAWLFERLLAKDAARAFLRDRQGTALAPADLELQSEAPGRFTARAPAGETVSVSVSRTGDDFIAKAEEARSLPAGEPEPALGETRK
jgi:acyl carrier protein